MQRDGNVSEDSLAVESEINDLEYGIPCVEATSSLESILWDLENDQKSNDSESVYSTSGITVRLNTVLNHCVLQGISTQIVSAEKRVNSGHPTVLANGKKFIAIGTSHGFIFTFDSSQKLCWCSRDTSACDQGAISALAFNGESTRLLAGYERGYISMLDTSSGDIIRRLPDAHAPHSAVLHLRYTDWAGLALCGDSAGCIFSLNFSRRLGMRIWDSKCLFSGARGEVCVFEPLIIQDTEHPLRRHVVVALATLSKIIVISVRPRLKVVFTYALPRIPTSLPLLTWQLVTIQTVAESRLIEPVLVFGRGSDLHFYRVQTVSNNKKVRLSLLRHVNLTYDLLALYWLGYRHLICMDTTETIKLIEVRTQKEVECLDVSDIGLVYGTAHFKGLATGGHVSAAFALAGEKACYNSLANRGNQLLILGMKSVHILRLRTWEERLEFLSSQHRWTEAMNLAADVKLIKKDVLESCVQTLMQNYIEKLSTSGVDHDSLQAAIKCCIKLNKKSWLYGDLWEHVCEDRQLLAWYFGTITEHINRGDLNSLNPSLTQALVKFHVEQNSLEELESVLLLLEIDCLDLNQVLKICHSHCLYDAWIHFVTKAMDDYTSPLTEFLPTLTPDNHRLGNAMLVYVSCCLAGLGYPRGKIISSQVQRVKHDVLRCLTAIHSSCAKQDELPYPYLRALLKYNTRECLNAIELAFNEAEFSGELGSIQKQRIIEILLQIVTEPHFKDNEIVNLVFFVTRLLSNEKLIPDQNILDSVIKSLKLLAGKSLNYRDDQEREQSWLDLMFLGKLDNMSAEELVQIALASKCYRMAEIVYEQMSNYADVIDCYILDVARHKDIFKYIRQYADDSRRCIKRHVVEKIKNLIEIDSRQTAHVILNYFPEVLEELCEKLKKSPNELFSLLTEIQILDSSLSPEFAEKYLEMLLTENINAVDSFIKTGNCRPEQALIIAKKAKHLSATTYYMEQMGDYFGALELLLDNVDEDNIFQAANICIRSAPHLEVQENENLWRTLLKRSPNHEIFKQLLYTAVQHVHISVLLELINSASVTDINKLLQALLDDSAYEKLLISTTFKILGNDLHRNLALTLGKRRQAVCIKNAICGLCQKSLLDDQDCIILFCQHIFHSRCLNNVLDVLPCPLCQNNATLLSMQIPVTIQKIENRLKRPDLEGIF